MARKNGRREKAAASGWRITISLLKRWRLFGVSSEEYEKCRDYVFRHNVKSVCACSLVAALLMIALSFYPGPDAVRRCIFYIPAGLLLILFALTFALRKREKFGAAQAALAVGFFVLIVALFSIITLLYSNSQYAIRFLVYFYVFEALLIFGPYTTILLNMAILTGFYLVCEFFPPENFSSLFSDRMFDFFNVTLAASISMALNWFTSYIHVKTWVLARSLTDERNRYREESVRDTLTGLNNRRSFEQSVDFYISVCGHVHQTVCSVMMDVDYFKLYNDYYGHPKGDLVLQAVGEVLKDLSDEEHVYSARVGGEEFIMLWTENRTIECERVALKLRQKIIDLNIPHNRSKVAPYVTASFGMYLMRGGVQSTAADLYRKTDAALYKAKEWGRNRIVLYDSQDADFREVDIRNYKELRRD